MAKDQPLPRQTLAKNLRALLDMTEMSAPRLAERAGVDRKTVYNQLNGRFDPRPEKVEQVAKVFGLTSWDLLSKNFKADKIANGRLQKLIELFQETDETGQDNILRIAEMAAKK